jgi:hypothetical protein
MLGGCTATVKVATMLVTEPLTLLTTTSNCAPLSMAVDVGVNV